MCWDFCDMLVFEAVSLEHKLSEDTLFFDDRFEEMSHDQKREVIRCLRQIKAESNALLENWEEAGYLEMDEPYYIVTRGY